MSLVVIALKCLFEPDQSSTERQLKPMEQLTQIYREQVKYKMDQPRYLKVACFFDIIGWNKVEEKEQEWCILAKNKSRYR